jgi:hypothetical protein
MITVDECKKTDANNQIIYQCPWCPCFFFNASDLERHFEAKEFKVTGKEPNQYDHKVQWKNILHYRDKVEPYENNDTSF